ncbi:MAG: hypothetical protein ACKOPO_06845 [Novosphingobium sp.]
MQKRTRTYLAMAHLGGIAVIGLAAAWALDWPDFLKGLMVGMLMIPLIVIPLRRMRDEYVDSLWRAGTAWAFVAVVASFLFAPFAEGVVDGFTGASPHQDWPASGTGYLAILAFFAGFHVKWLRG